MPSKIAIITILGDSPVDPGYGQLPGYGGGHPDQGLPGFPPHVGGGPIYGGGHPSHGLPGRPPHASTGPVWPGWPGYPDQGPPGAPPAAGHLPAPPPVTPDNSLPSAPPGAFVLVPTFTGQEELEGNSLFVLKLLNGYGWIFVPADFDGERPDQGLPPGRPNRPDQGLPGRPPRPDQGLPPGVGGGRPDQGLPPTAQPRR